MSLELRFTHEYYSISSFPTVTVPPLTVIVGKNGAGKTHLLKGIAEGKISSDIPSRDIRYLDWTSVTPIEIKPFESKKFLAERLEPVNNFLGNQSNERRKLEQWAQVAGLKQYESFNDVLGLDEPTLITHFGNPATASEKAKELKALLESAERRLLQSITGRGQSKEFIKGLAGSQLISVTEETLLRLLPTPLELTEFPGTVSQLFGIYRDHWLENQLLALANFNGQASSTHLSEEEFIAQYNLPPWDFVNGALSEAGLDLTVEPPYMWNFLPYKPRLRKRSSSAPIEYRFISSGEKVMLSFASSLYHKVDDQGVSALPRLLLLDEVEAPLHPSMCKSLLRLIQAQLVEKHQMTVMLTTHSPTTVALAPEGAVFLIRSGYPGIIPISKNAALNYLTEDVPTLAMSFEGRRQVFVESEADAQVLDCIYQILKPELASERALSFIASGSSDAVTGQSSNCGKSQVKRIVSELAGQGNKSVLGLIDWDLNEKSSERICILAEGRRYGIENCVFDPLLVAIAIARGAQKRKREIGLDLHETVTDFLQFDVARLQSIADNVQKSLLPQIDLLEKSVTVAYHGGFELQIAAMYLEHHCHQLEATILDVFPEFRGLIRQAHGKLLQYFAETVMKEVKRCVPREFADTFQRLLSAQL